MAWDVIVSFWNRYAVVCCLVVEGVAVSVVVAVAVVVVVVIVGIWEVVGIVV